MKDSTQNVNQSSTDLKNQRTDSLKNPDLPPQLQEVNLHAAGIDVGATSHFVAVPKGAAEQCVREFKSFTDNLHELADWLKACGVTTVAMESTGVYWIPYPKLWIRYLIPSRLLC